MLRKFLFVSLERSCDHPAVLMYDDETKKFSMSIPREARPHELPPIPMLLAKKGIYEVDDHWARIFVKERIVPPERQNIGQIMRLMGIKMYDEFAMLEWQGGRCCQDDFEMVEIQEGVEPSFEWWYDILKKRREQYGR